MDFDTAAKLSGARFVVLKGALARLSRALEQFMLDLHTTEHGYQEIEPPVLVRDAAMFGTAQLPKFREDQYFASRETDWSSAENALDSNSNAPWLTRPLKPNELRSVAKKSPQSPTSKRKRTQQRMRRAALS